MIHLSKLVAAVNAAHSVGELVNNVVESRTYTYGDIVTTVQQPASPGTASYATGLPYHLGFNDARSDWPSFMLTGHYTIGDVAKTYLVFTAGYSYDISGALNAMITVAADDPLIGTGTARTIAKGAALAEVLGYDDYMVVYHSDRMTGLSGQFPGLQWNPTYGAEPLDPPVVGAQYFFILDATIPEDSPALVNPHYFQPNGGKFTWTIPSGSPRLFGSVDQHDGGAITQRLWIIPLQEYITDTENITDLAMHRVGVVRRALQDSDNAIVSSTAQADASLATAIRALQDAFEDTSVFGSSVKQVVANTLAVREATNYIPRP